MNSQLSNANLIAPCGIDCGPCTIRRAPFDSHSAKKLVSWFKENNWLEDKEGITEIITRGMYCRGCRSDRKEIHWSPDCQILECCIYEKELAYCFECEEFICKRLKEWAKKDSKYKDALENLKALSNEKKI